MELSFFTTDNGSGYKTREAWFSKNYPNEYFLISEYCSNINIDLSFKEKIWFYFNKLTERPKCKTCGNDVKFKKSLNKAYGDFCSVECINNNKEEMIRRQKKTFNEKYGIDFFPQHKEFIKKQRKTKLSRYGNENYVNIEKRKKTNLNKHGDENYNNVKKRKKTTLKKYGVDNFAKSEKYKEIINDKYKSTYPTLLFVKINKSDVKIKCEKCNKTYKITKQNLYERNKRNQEICTICNPLGQSSQSTYEDEICLFLDEINVKHTRSNRILDNKQEIDILLTDYNIGIELNGLFWHNELFVSNDYHLKKTINSNNIGIDLIHIFEDEWNYKKDIVKSIIKNKIKKTETVIYARKCDIRIIDNNTAIDFLNNNHIQGSLNSKIRLGLFYNEKLVSVMTFSKGRIIMGGKNNEWELNRFCSLINHNVIGGANRLFKYFLENYEVDKIISYSDKRLFDGELYKKLGFIEKTHSKPNYWYVINGKRHYRFNFRKSVLIKEGYDKNSTEKKIMLDRKIYRIYDCGNIRWEFSI